MVFIYLLLAVFLLAYVYLTWNFDYWSKRGVPSAKAKPLLGSLPSIILRKKHLTYDFDDLYAEFKGKTPFVGITQIRSPRLLILEPEVCKDVMIRNFKNFHDNEFGNMIDKKVDPLFGRNPFMLQGEEWKEKRAEITPAFTSSRLKALYPLMLDVQTRMIKYVNDQCKISETFDARELSAKYTTDVVSNSIFGIDAQSFTKEKAEIREQGRKLLAPAGLFILKMFLVSAIPTLKKVINMRFVPVDLQDFFTDLMDQALKYREDNKIQREDFLDYLIQLQKKKNLEKIEMAAHTISFFTDGFETSAIAIAHALYEIAKNKRVQDKLREEIKKHCDDEGRLSFDKVHEISYLEQVFHESLRLHPPATFVSRLCTEEIELEFQGQKVQVEKDLNLYIPLYQFHYDPQYYENPTDFYPERFDPENGGVKAFKDKGVFLPFGDGPRVCLGMRIAHLQSLSAIAALVSNFEMTVNSKTAKKLIIDPNEFINLKIGGLWLDIKPIS